MAYRTFDVDYPNGDMDCTVRVRTHDADDVRFLSLNGTAIDFPVELEDGWKIIIFVQAAPHSRAAESTDLPYITGVTELAPKEEDTPSGVAVRHMQRIRAVTRVMPIYPEDSSG